MHQFLSKQSWSIISPYVQFPHAYVNSVYMCAKQQKNLPVKICHFKASCLHCNNVRGFHGWNPDWTRIFYPRMKWSLNCPRKLWGGSPDLPRTRVRSFTPGYTVSYTAYPRENKPTWINAHPLFCFEVLAQEFFHSNNTPTQNEEFEHA